MKDPAANRSTRSQSRKHRNNGVFVHKEPPSCRPLPLQSFRPRPDSSASQRSSSFVKNGTTHPKAEPIISGTEDECAEIPVRLPLAEQSPAKELKNSAAPLPALKYNKNAVAIGLGELNFSFETRRGLPDTQEEHECLRPLIRGDAGESIEERMRRAIERVGGTGIEGEVRDAYFEGEANYKRCRNRLFGQGKRSVNRETVHRRARSVARGTGNKVSPRPKMRRGKPLLSESLRSIYQPDAPSRRPRNNPQKRPAFIHHARHRSLAAPVPSRLIPEHDTPAASYEQEFAARFPCFAPSPGVDWADSTLYRNIREGIFSAAKRDIMEELGLNASRRHANTHERLRDVRGSLVQIFILVNERDKLVSRNIRPMVPSLPLLNSSQRAYLASLQKSLMQVTQRVLERIADFRAGFPEFGPRFVINGLDYEAVCRRELVEVDRLIEGKGKSRGEGHVARC